MNLKDIVCDYINPEDGALEFLIYFIISHANFYIHRHKILKISPKVSFFSYGI